MKEVIKHIQICTSKREYYESYRKNLNNKIYMMMNRKDVEAYQKSYVTASDKKLNSASFGKSQPRGCIESCVILAMRRTPFSYIFV